MAQNIEIKARVESVDCLASRVAAVAERSPIEIRRDDTFFACDRGRLKLREFSSTEGELIFYQRRDDTGPKQSVYVISRTAQPNSLREALSRPYGQIGRVRKNRTLYLLGRKRVHLDRVEGLGHSLELGVVLSEEAGIEKAQRIIALLGFGLG